ncbi:NUDIX domain-containing protein [Gemmatimonas sp.]|uniref:NUDIX domain-containing protein n=1 Tax=Gemmatimonas sp. TaxID=1962908 RepID=UPI003F7095DE
MRHHGARAEVLVFEHPSAGTQLVKGTVEAGESVVEAAVRELAEESGIVGAACKRELGQWTSDPGDQVWHFWEMTVPHVLPDSWSHLTQDDGGQLFAFRWHPIAEPPASSWYPVFRNALSFLRARLGVRSPQDDCVRDQSTPDAVADRPQHA